MDASPDHGPAIATYGRTTGQNAGVGCLVLCFLALPVAVLLQASTVYGYLAGGVLGLVLGATVVLIARQVLPNWNVRWTLYERGFARTRAGTTEAYAFTGVAAIRFRPAREALVQLADGKELLIEGFAGSDELSLRLDEAVGRVALPAVERRLATEGRVTLGPLTFTPAGLLVRDQRFAWHEVVLQDTEVTVAVHGNTSQVWVLFRRGDTQTVEVPVGEVPLPWVARALLDRGCRSGSPLPPS